MDKRVVNERKRDDSIIELRRCTQYILCKRHHFFIIEIAAAVLRYDEEKTSFLTTIGKMEIKNKK